MLSREDADADSKAVATIAHSACSNSLDGKRLMAGSAVGAGALRLRRRTPAVEHDLAEGLD